MEGATRTAVDRAQPRSAGGLRVDGARDLLGGGIDGNEQLTAMAGVILVALFAVLGAIVLIPDLSLWTAPGAFPHHHHEG